MAAAARQTAMLVGITLVAPGLLTIIVAMWFAPKLGVSVFMLLPVLVVPFVVLARPIVGVWLLAMLIPLDSVWVAGGAVTATRLLALIVFGAWLLQKFATRESWERITTAGHLKPAFYFLALAFASFLWADRPGLAIEPFTSTFQLLLLSLLVADVVSSNRQLEWVLKFLLLGALVALIITISQSFSPVIVGGAAARAGHGVTGNPNQTARYLVLLVPFAFFLLRACKEPIWRMIGLAYLGLAPWTILATLSRASYVVLPIVLGSQAWGMLKGSHGVNRFLLLTIGLALGAIIIATIPWGPAWGRASTIAPAVQGGRTDDGKLASSRPHHWIGAMLMFKDHPLLGVGYGNFGHHFFTYQFLVPEKFAGIYHSILRSPHSTVFGILAELGFVGAALWGWLLGASLFSVRKSWTRSKEFNDRFLEILSQTVFFTLLAYMMYSVVAVTLFDKLFWLLLGITAVLARLTSSYERRPEPSRDAVTRLD